MSVKIIAIAPNDGWAFIVKEEKILLIRPPYLFSNQIEASGKVVENAIHLHGFKECELTYNSVAEVVRFLKDKYVESCRNQGMEVPSLEKLKELLKYASVDILKDYFEKAKNKLIPERKLDAAKSLVLELMKLQQVKNSAELIELGVEILESCRREEELKILSDVIIEDRRQPWKERFPNAVEKYKTECIIMFQKVITGRKQFLRLGKQRG